MKLILSLFFILFINWQSLKSQHIDSIPKGSVYFEVDTITYLSEWSLSPKTGIFSGRTNIFDLRINCFGFLKQGKYKIRNQIKDTTIYIRSLDEIFPEAFLRLTVAHKDFPKGKLYTSSNCTISLGNINITKIDSVNQYVEGTFEAMLCSETGEEIKVRNGIIHQVPLDSPNRKLSDKEMRRIDRQRKRWQKKNANWEKGLKIERTILIPE